MIQHTANQRFNRRQAIATGIAGIAGATAIGLNAQANARQTDPAPKSANAKGRFAGQVVSITGATSGIGRAAAIAFACEGAKVGFCGRREFTVSRCFSTVGRCVQANCYRRGDC
ncbi:SDR family NAD(P)-dependent oxidoreductase [Altericista sp. CCNU0014]|uniref:SDR family NAD(P)-dependent oxidoreductase n=1 Tax=Altericista sp. CCNU0014 TaxID=3082949 RepID=UPI00384D6EA2